MLTNEQRAHDLALVAAQSALKGENNDIYDLYLQAYRAALKAFNRDFPQNKQ